MSYNFPIQLPSALLDGGPGIVRKYPAHYGNLGYPRAGQARGAVNTGAPGAADTRYMWNREPSGLHVYRGRLCESRAAVVHVVQEPNDDYESAPVWFASEQAPNSMHAYGDGDGDLYQLVDNNHPAWGHGTSSTNTRQPRPDWYDGYSYNTCSHGLELEGYVAEITERWRDDPGNAQRRTASIWLALEASRDGWPLDRAHVVGHEELATTKTDPGIASHGFPIAELIAEARERLGGVGTGTAPQPGAVTDDQLRAAKHEAWVQGWRNGWHAGHSAGVTSAIELLTELAAEEPASAPTPNPPLGL